MIVRTFYERRFDGVKLYKTYSDSNHYIKQLPTGAVYSEAIDVENAPYAYEETDELIEDNQEKEAFENAQEQK